MPPRFKLKKAVPYPKSAKTTKGRKENQKLPLFLVTNKFSLCKSCEDFNVLKPLPG